MTATRIVLVQPPIQDFYLTAKRTIPYGLAGIAASLKKAGYKVTLIDALATAKAKNIDLPEKFSFLTPFYGKKDRSLFSLFHQFKHFGYSFQHIAATVNKINPMAVGISSSFTPYFSEAVKTAREIKKWVPDSKIILGGHHPTQFPEQVLAHDCVDFVLRGEGEISMVQLCDVLRNKADLKKVPGIGLKKEKGYFISDPSWVNDLNILPLPDTDLINHRFYQRNQLSAITIVSSRGCPFKCSYCCVSAASSHVPFRQRSVESVVAEISTQLETKEIGFIDFEDENISLNKKWFMALLSELQTLFAGRPVELRAMNGLYPPTLDEEIIKMMRKTGFTTLNLSVGSTSKVQLDRFNRPDVRSAFETVLKLAAQYHLPAASYLIAGAPGQDPQTTLADLIFLAQQKTIIGLSIYYPAPGSADYQKCRDQDLLPDDFRLMRSAAFPIDQKTSRIQSVTLLRLARIINYMKRLIKETGKLPDPEPFPSVHHEPFINSSDRYQLSEKLLQYFLHDGVIRGVDGDGRIYSHCIDLKLTRQFLEKMKTIQIR